jgi:membrane protein
MKSILNNFKNVKNFFISFMDAKPFTYSSSIAFYTIFSLPAIVYLVVLTSSIFYGEDAITGRLSQQINKLVGQEAADTIEELLQNVHSERDSTLATILSFVTLIIGSTTVFGAIQSGLNEIWVVKSDDKKGWVKILLDRAFSFTVVVSMGFLMIVSLLIETLLQYFSEYLIAYFPSAMVFLASAFSFVLSIVVTALLFTLIMKVLPDKKISWKHAFYGGAFTSVLFSIGKYLIGFYIAKSDPGTSYGAAGSLVLLLVWVYYSSLILLLGGKFTQTVAFRNDQKLFKLNDNQIGINYSK